MFVNANEQASRVASKLSKRYNVDVTGSAAFVDKKSNDMIISFSIKSENMNSKMHTLLKNRGFETKSSGTFYYYRYKISKGTEIYTVLNGVI